MNIINQWRVSGDFCVCPVCETEFYGTCNNILGQWDNEGVDCRKWMPKWNYCPDCGVNLNMDESELTDSGSYGYWNVSCRGKVCECSSCGSEFDNTCNDILGEWSFCPHCGKPMTQK